MSAIENKKCINCDNFRRLYVGSNLGFWKTNHYYCKLFDIMTEPHRNCEMWRRKSVAYDISEQRFEEVENDLKFLIDFYKDK